MGYWNYRLMARDEGLVVNSVGELEPATVYFIAEVYYDEDDVPIEWIEATPEGNNIYKVRVVYNRMNDAFQKPVIHENEFGGANESKTDESDCSGCVSNVSGAPEDTKSNRQREIL